VRTLYNIVFAFGFCLSAPYYLLKMLRRGNWRGGFRQRFARYDARVKQSVTNRQVLWLHAVSVGEVNLCTQLILAIEKRVPNIKILVSTTTSTGMGELRKKLPGHIGKIYFPIDFRGYASKALATFHPQAVVLVEAEIWPNFIWNARKRGIPLFLVNARLSERSCRGYKRFGFLFRSLFAAFQGVGAQNPADAERLKELGCRPEAVHVIGSMKFDAARVRARRLLDVPGMLRQLGVPEGARILVAGSTHDGEEALLAEQFKRLREKFDDLFLIVVPRHHERGREVGRELEARGIRFAYRTEVTPTRSWAPRSLDCLLVNTTGELRYFYEQAAVVFVGKSLTAQGGQNPIEPAALAKPVVFGPNMQNFGEVVKAFLAQAAAVQVRDAAELEKAFAELLADERRRAELGQRAAKVVRENLGALDRTVEMIVECLDDDVYVKPGP
jgi:3-deoxy-D-manno-octulosonic-acid transferase